MSPLQAFGLMLVAILVLCIFRIQKKKEMANHVARQFCRRNELQFLDGTVAFRGLHLERSTNLIVYRFRFEYSAMSVDRFSGFISIIGNHGQNVFVNPEHVVPRDPVEPDQVQWTQL